MCLTFVTCVFVATSSYCRGYTDEHGHWNNGFSCTVWAEPERDYCCGPPTHRYCCAADDQQQPDTDTSTSVQSQ